MREAIAREIGAKIKARRQKLGISQNELSRRLDVSFQAVSKWERGENAPDIALLAALADLLQVSTDWLLNRSVKEYAAACYIFQGLSATEIGGILEFFTSRYYAPAESIYMESEQPAQGLYLIETGEVEVRQRGKELGRLKGGEIFSDYSFFDEGNCITSAMALEESYIHCLPARKFEAIKFSHPRETIIMLQNELARLAHEFRSGVE